ncbi:carbohydrate ABC transporter permease [Paenibacillus solisilvae]|uniref:Carbohydrate ABC transporter permease n=1 Tax=Paenibacillus solisilvae TaxID=2486751 RepID=A0ABW0W0R1_9BACL
MRILKTSTKIYYLVLIPYGLFTAFCFAWLVVTSLKSNASFFATSPWSFPDKFQWGNYIRAWEIANIGSYFVNSMIVTTVATLGTLIIASMAAYIVARIPFRWSGMVQIFFLVGMMLPPFMIVIPLYSVLQTMFLLNSIWGLIFVYITTQIPFNLFIISSFYKSIPYDYEEAAAIDGAGPFHIFARIIAPQTWPALVGCGIINVLHNWNEFLYALVFVSDKKNYTLPLGLFRLNETALYSADWVTLFAGMAISSVPVLILFALMQKHFTSGMSQGALK